MAPPRPCPPTPRSDRKIDGKRTNRRYRRSIEDRRPVNSAVGRFPNCRHGCPGVIEHRVGVRSGYVAHSSAGNRRSDRAKRAFRDPRGARAAPAPLPARRAAVRKSAAGHLDLDLKLEVDLKRQRKIAGVDVAVRRRKGNGEVGIQGTPFAATSFGLEPL